MLVLLRESMHARKCAVRGDGLLCSRSVGSTGLLQGAPPTPFTIQLRAYKESRNKSNFVEPLSRFVSKKGTEGGCRNAGRVVNWLHVFEFARKKLDYKVMHNHCFHPSLIDSYGGKVHVFACSPLHHQLSSILVGVAHQLTPPPLPYHRYRLVHMR